MAVQITEPEDGEALSTLADEEPVHVRLEVSCLGIYAVIAAVYPFFKSDPPPKMWRKIAN